MLHAPVTILLALSKPQDFNELGAGTKVGAQPCHRMKQVVSILSR